MLWLRFRPKLQVSLAKKDSVELSAARSGIFSCAKTWEAIRSKLPVDGGWFGIHLIYQDNSFICWLTVRDRLTALDRLLKWDYQGDCMCVFCRGCVETRDHIFFECPFPMRIWLQIEGFFG